MLRHRTFFIAGILLFATAEFFDATPSIFATEIQEPSCLAWAHFDTAGSTSIETEKDTVTTDHQRNFLVFTILDFQPTTQGGDCSFVKRGMIFNFFGGGFAATPKADSVVQFSATHHGPEPGPKGPTAEYTEWIPIDQKPVTKTDGLVNEKQNAGRATTSLRRGPNTTSSTLPAGFWKNLWHWLIRILHQ